MQLLKMRWTLFGFIDDKPGYCAFKTDSVLVLQKYYLVHV